MHRKKKKKGEKIVKLYIQGRNILLLFRLKAARETWTHSKRASGYAGWFELRAQRKLRAFRGQFIRKLSDSIANFHLPLISILRAFDLSIGE